MVEETNHLEVTFSYTGNVEEAKKLLDSIPTDTVACDFEAASKLSPARRTYLEKRLNLPALSVSYKNKLLQQLNADGLSHPSLVDITHFGIAWSETEAIVLVTNSREMREFVYDWIVTTTKKQVWHNAGFDFKHIYYHTNKFPKDFEDSQQLAKVLLNDADNFKSQTGLKKLMGYAYTPKWKDLADGFAPVDPFDPDFLLYAAIDPCATWKLWQDIHLHPLMKDLD